MHRFLEVDTRTQRKDLYSKLGDIPIEMKEKVNGPDLHCVLCNIPDGADGSCGHSD